MMYSTLPTTAIGCMRDVTTYGSTILSEFERVMIL